MKTLYLMIKYNKLLFINILLDYFLKTPLLNLQNRVLNKCYHTKEMIEVEFYLKDLKINKDKSNKFQERNKWIMLAIKVKIL